MLFKEENMKKWLNIQEYSQKMTLLVEEVAEKIPEKKKIMMEIVAEGETRILKGIEDIMMREIPEKIN